MNSIFWLLVLLLSRSSGCVVGWLCFWFFFFSFCALSANNGTSWISGSSIYSWQSPAVTASWQNSAEEEHMCILSKDLLLTLFSCRWKLQRRGYIHSVLEPDNLQIVRRGCWIHKAEPPNRECLSDCVDESVKNSVPHRAMIFKSWAGHEGL